MSQGSAATASRWGGQISNYLLPNFLVMLCAKNHEKLSIFDEFIAKTKRVTFFASQSSLQLVSFELDVVFFYVGLGRSMQ